MFIVYDGTTEVTVEGKEIKTIGDILKFVSAVFQTYEDAYNYIFLKTNGNCTDVSDEYDEVTEDYENEEEPCIVAVLGNDDKIFYVQYIGVNMLNESGEMFKKFLEEPL